MMRMTGFIAFAAAVITAITFVILGQFTRMPEPYASCVELHRDNPDYGLERLRELDLVLDEDASGVRDGREGDIGYSVIEASVAPAGGTAGGAVTIECYRIDGHDGLIVDPETFHRMIGRDDS